MARRVIGSRDDFRENLMLLDVQAVATPISPAPKAGAAPTPPQRRGPALKGDVIAKPAARRSVPVSPPPKHLVDGTPEVLVAGLALAGMAVGADVAAAGAGTAIRSSASYASQLLRSIGRCVADPQKTGEHIAEGVVGGAAWAAAATGVGALAEAARARVSIAAPGDR
jgi:hypothetical protein